MTKPSSASQIWVRPNLHDRHLLFFLVFAWIICQQACAGTLWGQEITGTAPESERLETTVWSTTTQLFIHVEIDKEWHIYAPGSKAGVPFSIEMQKESDFVVAGDIHVEQDEKGVVARSTTLRVPIKRSGTGNQLAFQFDYQACDALECDQPERLEFTGVVSRTSPKRILLVVDANDERAKRISTLIKDTGMECVVHQYAENLTQEICNSYDVIVTDCPGFRNSKDGFAAVKKFPKTDTPILASGFLGTELIENHQLAMTSGYI